MTTGSTVLVLRLARVILPLDKLLRYPVEEFKDNDQAEENALDDNEDPSVHRERRCRRVKARDELHARVRVVSVAIARVACGCVLGVGIPLDKGHEAETLNYGAHEHERENRELDPRVLPLPRDLSHIVRHVVFLDPEVLESGILIVPFVHDVLVLDQVPLFHEPARFAGPAHEKRRAPTTPRTRSARPCMYFRNTGADDMKRNAR
ncbi:hypothetical protein PsorP6_007936 [Peronosclerospora sorghi]|uniref:Uncharacterized protein n=1 Tax=Peronosclerospora sorghi TaxID=230839 RepID=A0ACC0WBM8_9STRA|nr:hypothetical protein PsorP6_007936 [Peronosclerospora sorghi]